MKTRLFIFCGALFVAVQMLAQGFDFTALDSSYVTCTTGGYYSPYFKQGVVPGRHTVITEQVLCDAGIINSAKDGVKVLANGELTKQLTVAVACSTGAAEKIVAAGGKVEVK